MERGTIGEAKCKMPCLDRKISSASVQDWISWQDHRHVEEDLGFTHDVRLPESTVSDCCRKKQIFYRDV